MKKLALIVGSGILVIFLLVAGAGLYVNAHLEEIASEMSGMDIRFAGLRVGFSPTPTIVVSDVAMKKDGNTVNIPEITLYPDLGNILKGRINLKKAVLTEPVVNAGGWNNNGQNITATNSGEEAFSMAAVPDGLVVVNRGKFVLHGKAEKILPVALTVQAEKTGGRLAIRLENASIDEIGLKFAGEVAIDSLAPLKATVHAGEGTFNPSAVKDFLVAFGYLTNDQSDMIPRIERIDARGLKVDIDAASGAIGLAAETVAVDRVSFKDVALTLAGDDFTVACSQGIVDAGSVFGWLQQTPDTQEMLASMLRQAGLKRLTPEGNVTISSLSFRGKPPEAEGGQLLDSMAGSADVGIQGLVLRLTAENGREQNLTIGQLDAKISIEQGKPTLQVDQLSFSSSEGGNGTLSGKVPLSPEFKEMTLKSSIEGFKVFDSTLDFHLDKTQTSKAVFDLALNAPSINVSTDGSVFIPGSGQTDLETRINSLRIVVPDPGPTATAASATPDAFGQPFDIDVLLDNKLSAKASVHTLRLNTFAPLKNVDMRITPSKDRAIVQGSARMCGMDVTLGAVGLPPNRLITTVEAKGTDIDLTSLIACFSNELPVFLAGRLYFLGNFAADGDTPRALMDHAEGDVTMVLTEASVRRISGLDSRLGFILDILRAARISSENHDTITVDKGIVNATLKDGRLDVDKFSIAGPLFTAWGSGDFTIKDNHLKISGGVKTALGITSKLNIDRILEKGEI